MRWEPKATAETTPTAATWPKPPFLVALGRGLRNRCPVCDEGKVFNGYLKVVPECAVCHAPLGSLRADDAPPYFTIFIAGHLVLPWVFVIENRYEPPIWLDMVVWLPVFTIVCTLLLRPIKGAVVGWMCALGFDGQDRDMPAPALPASPHDARAARDA